MNNKKLVILMEIAIMAGLSFILGKLAFSLPQGGSISFGMLPIVLVAFRHGLFAGMATGLLEGVISAMMGGYILHWLQAILDFGVASTVIGLAAVVRRPLLNALHDGNKNAITGYMTTGVLLGATLSLIAHVLSGVVFFSEYAGDQNPWIYSIIYNVTHMVPSAILTIIVGSLLFATAPRLLKVA
ncbi:energy-coupled thiamine transporter ThiT [Metasolibacillus meyeri]|uniref:energy-coupled thiamine transporter ThiT n=1 Tax=Metasolibacillus meyeri TaxID=1071052 RepID=UPI000D301FBE|nr:energy-coupled thiamine transporter ThiT [Metasolibacillus meyeri]